MVLQTIKENSAWVQMTWKCSYLMKWPNILYVANAMLGQFTEPEVIIGDRGTGGQRVNPATMPEKKSMLVLRGTSKFFKGKTSLTFNTDTNDVVLLLPKSLNLPTDYESMSKAAGLFMDSIELKMFTAH